MTLYYRAFVSDMQRTGRTLTGRLVPYGVVTSVLDEVPGAARPDIYQEGFRRGAFAAQVQAAANKGVINKISLNHRHEGGLGFLGPFTALYEADDGLYGSAEVLRSKADDVEDLLTAGVDELSVEFRLTRGETPHTEVDDKGVRWRVRAHLDGVALEPRGAYRTAQVLAFRAEADEEAEAAARAAQEAEEAEQAQERERAEAESAAEAIVQRRAQWDAFMARYEADMERQAQLVKDYGFTRPPAP